MEERLTAPSGSSSEIEALGPTGPEGLTWISCVSAGLEGDVAKNQDRVSLFPERNISCVCDGTGSSPFADEAADVASELAPHLFDAPSRDAVFQACDEIRGALRRQREVARQRPITVNSEWPEAMQDMLQQAMQEQLLKSHQTTMVAVEVTPQEQTLYVRLFKCGDSEAFVFSSAGNLLYPTDAPSLLAGSPQASSEREWRFRSRSNRTAVLPDSPNKAIEWRDDLVFERGSSVLLATDGFISCFESPGAMFDWLRANEDDLRSGSVGEHNELVEALHERLRDRQSDDDISFVWVLDDQFGHRRLRDGEQDAISGD